MRRTHVALLRATTLVVLAVATPALARAQAQNQIIQKAVDLENAGKWRDAIAAWRAVIADGAAGQGVLGLERVFTQLAQDDSVLPAIDSLLAKTPADRTLRGSQLRVLRALGRDKEARAAFDSWVALMPRDPTPYREFAGQLLFDGRVAAADTILQLASRDLGSTAELRIEVAQLRAGLGLWTEAAVAWRDALTKESYLESAAVYSLQPAPAARRDSMRAVLGAMPSPAAVRKTLGTLELNWGSAREGWRVLSTLAPADSAWDSWNDFAQDAERYAAWLPARDALMAMNQLRPNPTIAIRAANASLSGGDPAAALPLLAVAKEKLQPFAFRLQVLPLQVRALSQLGRATEAEALVNANTEFLDVNVRKAFARQLAWGWIRAGQPEKARAAIGGASGDDEDEVTAWLALYDGDLAKARPGLRHPTEATAEVVTAMALLGRTKADTSRLIGSAFLALARGDSVQAAVRFEKASDELSDAAPLLLMLAARINSARRQDAAAIVLWQKIVSRHGTAPEAAEADLEWARTLRRKGDVSGAVERLEHLILTYPQSALVPQARRELDAVRAGANS